MADAVAARREARRKRILENSHNRLQFISGKVENELSKESAVTSPVFESCTNISVGSETSSISKTIGSDSSSSSRSLLYNGTILSEPETSQPLSTRHETSAGNEEVASDLAALLSSSTDVTNGGVPSLWEKLRICRYDIVLLSLVIQILYTMSAVSLYNTYFFVPLVIYSLTKLMWFPIQNKSNLALAILLLNNISKSRLNKLISITQWLGILSQDLCVFLFTTICIQSLCISIKDMLNT